MGAVGTNTNVALPPGVRGLVRSAASVIEVAVLPAEKAANVVLVTFSIVENFDKSGLVHSFWTVRED